MNTYIFLYNFRGIEATFAVVADTQQEAEERVAAMKSAQYEGKLYAEIPISDEEMRGFTGETIH